MYTLTILDGKNKYRVSFHGTPTVQQVLEANAITMPHPCGGIGRCGKCAINIIGEISLPDETELAAGCRLSCRTRLYGNAIVTLCADTKLLAESTTNSITGSPNLFSQIGAAVDIGTTTVALSVYDLASGACLAAETMLNPQSTIAADVIGRIDAAAKGRLSELQAMTHSCIKTLAEQSGYSTRINTWCITGNTVMLHLLQGKNPEKLAVAPYTAKHLFGEEILFFGQPAYLPNCMHAFVGADITCAVLASGMCDKKETSLLCDIGTNGEIVLCKNGKLYTTSTAAGPVFEGAGISCGCQSIAGAIETVTYKNNTLFIQTIGNVQPIGLCGSGVIDTVACLLNSGILDETGTMEEDAFYLCDTISFTREDVRNVQLAKAAIAAGIRTLLTVTDTAEEEIATFYLAGGFGSHINLTSAVRIGLFPASLKKKVNILGNAALKGAASMLTCNTLKEKAKNISESAEYIALSNMPSFNKTYLSEMFFPE